MRKLKELDDYQDRIPEIKNALDKVSEGLPEQNVLLVIGTSNDCQLSALLLGSTSDLTKTLEVLKYENYETYEALREAVYAVEGYDKRKKKKGKKSEAKKALKKLKKLSDLMELKSSMESDSRDVSESFAQLLDKDPEFLATSKDSMMELFNKRGVKIPEAVTAATTGPELVKAFEDTKHRLGN